jgi:hypothetical protein
MRELIIAKALSGNAIAIAIRSRGIFSNAQSTRDQAFSPTMG